METVQKLCIHYTSKQYHIPQRSLTVGSCRWQHSNRAPSAMIRRAVAPRQKAWSRRSRESGDRCALEMRLERREGQRQVSGHLDARPEVGGVAPRAEGRDGITEYITLGFSSSTVTEFREVSHLSRILPLDEYFTRPEKFSRLKVWISRMIVSIRASESIS